MGPHDRAWLARGSGGKCQIGQIIRGKGDRRWVARRCGELAFVEIGQSREDEVRLEPEARGDGRKGCWKISGCVKLNACFRPPAGHELDKALGRIGGIKEQKGEPALSTLSTAQASAAERLP